MALRVKNKTNIKTHTFPNGFRLIYEPPQTTLPITSIYTYCDIGSAYETDDCRGVSHFIEHMCFKGTKKIPSPQGIFSEYDNVGAFFNATTDKRYTVYTIKTRDEYSKHCIQIMSDMLLNSIFNKKEFEKEERVVIEENIRANEEAAGILDDMTEEMMYKGSSYAFPVDSIDYHKNIRFSYEKVVEIYRGFYLPERMILSIVSNVPFNEIVKSLETSYFAKTFGANRITVGSGGERMNSGTLVKELLLQKHNIHFSNITQNDIQYNIQTKPGTSTIHLNIAFRTCNRYSHDKYVLNMLKHILGGSLGSRLSLILREKNGLTYTSDVYTDYNEFSGQFVIYAQVDQDKIIYNKTNSLTKVPELGRSPTLTFGSRLAPNDKSNKTKGKTNKNKGVLPLIIGLLNDLVKNGITESELTTTKKNIFGKMTIRLEDTSIQASNNGFEYLVNGGNANIITPYSQIYDTHLKEITKKQIDDIIIKYFKRSCMNVALVGGKNPSEDMVRRECEKYNL